MIKTKTSDPKNRRKHVRIPARFAVLMKLDAVEFPDYTMEAEVLNISEGGVLLSLPDIRSDKNKSQNADSIYFYGDLKFESLMTWLQFILPNSNQTIRALGKPAWINKPDQPSKQCLVAMQFTHISSEDRSKLSNFIKQKLSAVS